MKKGDMIKLEEEYGDIFKIIISYDENDEELLSSIPLLSSLLSLNKSSGKEEKEVKYLHLRNYLQAKL